MVHCTFIIVIMLFIINIYNFKLFILSGRITNNILLLDGNIIIYNINCCTDSY